MRRKECNRVTASSFPRFLFLDDPQGDTLYLSIAGGEGSGPMIRPAANSLTIFDSMIPGYCVADGKAPGAAAVLSAEVETTTERHLRPAVFGRAPWWCVYAAKTELER